MEVISIRSTHYFLSDSRKVFDSQSASPTQSPHVPTFCLVLQPQAPSHLSEKDPPASSLAPITSPALVQPRTLEPLNPFHIIPTSASTFTKPLAPPFTRLLESFVNMPQAADILSDPEINQAYEDVRSDKSETTWLVLKVSYTHISTSQSPYLFPLPIHGPEAEECFFFADD